MTRTSWMSPAWRIRSTPVKASNTCGQSSRRASGMWVSAMSPMRMGSTGGTRPILASARVVELARARAVLRRRGELGATVLIHVPQRRRINVQRDEIRLGLGVGDLVDVPLAAGADGAGRQPAHRSGGNQAAVLLGLVVRLGDDALDHAERAAGAAVIV